MNIKLGFIGAGNMGSALLKRIAKSGMVEPGNIFVYDVDAVKLQELKNDLKINISENSRAVAEYADYIILAVKPGYIEAALEGCKHSLNDDKVLISIAVGVPIKTYKGIVGNKCKIVRTMPNTPALVGEGMTLVSFDSTLGREERENVVRLFECVGKVEELDENLMSEVTALTGSSPAYVFMFIEAMADAAVLSGISRSLAYKLASQAVLGSAKMVLDTGRHPGELKDQVCSPAGTTIEAVAALEKHGLRYAVMDAMAECTKRAREISRMYK